MSGDGALLRARSRHTRWLSLGALAALLFAEPACDPHGWPARLAVIVGYLLVTLGALIRIYSAVFIGGWKNARLAAAGPYSVVRNPLYVGSFLAALGVGLQTQTVTLTAAFVVVIGAYYVRTVQREEAYLSATFGDTYREYLRAVPRWWPALGQWRIPETIEARPHYILNGVRDVVPMLLAYPALEGVRLLHDFDVVPRLYHLW